MQAVETGGIGGRESGGTADLEVRVEAGLETHSTTGLEGLRKAHWVEWESRKPSRRG
jgi:hypothetical protein